MLVQPGQVPCERTFVNAVQHLRDYGTFSPVNRNRGRSRSRRVLDLKPVILQAVENECFQFHNLENAARTRITSLSSSTCPTLKTRRSTTTSCILSMASSKNRRRTQFFKHRLNPQMKQDLLEMEFSIPIIPTSGQKKIHTKSENVVSNKDFRLTCNWESFDRITCLTSTFKW
jgi:hypothetical protein